jgi:hypothetical protein
VSAPVRDCDRRSDDGRATIENSNDGVDENTFMTSQYFDEWRDDVFFPAVM